VFFEAGWLWAYHDYEPAGTLANNFTLVLGVSSAWKVLAIGLVCAVGAAARQALGLKSVRVDARKAR
jgi:hypothetical protein